MAEEERRLVRLSQRSINISNRIATTVTEIKDKVMAINIPSVLDKIEGLRISFLNNQTTMIKEIDANANGIILENSMARTQYVSSKIFIQPGSIQSTTLSNLASNLNSNNFSARVEIESGTNAFRIVSSVPMDGVYIHVSAATLTSGGTLVLLTKESPKSHLFELHPYLGEYTTVPILLSSLYSGSFDKLTITYVSPFAINPPPPTIRFLVRIV